MVRSAQSCNRGWSSEPDAGLGSGQGVLMSALRTRLVAGRGRRRPPRDHRDCRLGHADVRGRAGSGEGRHRPSLRNELGRHPDEAAWRKNRTARAAQVSETLRRHLKLDPKFSGTMTQYVEQLFGFRSRAVHPNGSWVQPNYRPEIDSGVHPHLITFSGPHAKQCRPLTLELLESLTGRAAELSSPDAETGWIDRGRSEIKRLTALYPRRADDEPVAFSEYLATPPVQ